MDVGFENLCRIEACGKLAKRDGLCWGHVKRRQRRLPVAAELRARNTDPKNRLMEAIYTILEIRPTDEDGWRRAWHRLRMAATRYARADKAGNRYRRERSPQGA